MVCTTTVIPATGFFVAVGAASPASGVAGSGVDASVGWGAGSCCWIVLVGSAAAIEVGPAVEETDEEALPDRSHHPIASAPTSSRARAKMALQPMPPHASGLAAREPEAGGEVGIDELGAGAEALLAVEGTAAHSDLAVLNGGVGGRLALYFATRSETPT